MKIVRSVLMLLLLLWVSSALADDAPPPDTEKRKQIASALEKGILTPYDVPFNTYITLGMWEPVDQMLRRNFQNTQTVRLPGKYYSRPLVMAERIWVFENGSEKGGEIYIFSPESLKLQKVLKDDAFNFHASGVRALHPYHIVSGGSDENVDRVVVWNIETGRITLPSLSDGHYISALAVENERLYAGACGGVVNAWQVDDLSPIRVYKATSEDISDWQVFNRQECIHHLFFFNDQLIGVGDRHIFFWDLETGKRIKKITKIFPNGNICFFEGKFIEFAEDRFAVRPVNHPDDVRLKKVKRPINDLIVTREKVLPDQDGPVIALTAHYNRGILFYDLKTLDLMAATELKGESLCQYEGAVFATDDRHLYRHDIRSREPEEMERFLQGLSLKDLPCTDAVYASLKKRGEKYPQAIDLNALGRWFLDGKKLSLIQEMEKGKIGHQLGDAISDSDDKAIMGRKLMYEIDNASDTPYYLRMVFQWPVQGRDDTEAAVWVTHYEDVLAPPHQGSEAGIVVLGETTPERLWVYPESVTPLPQDYYSLLMRALSPDNRDAELIEQFLKDERVRRWHPDLLLRRQMLNAGGN